MIKLCNAVCLALCGGVRMHHSSDDLLVFYSFDILSMELMYLLNKFNYNMTTGVYLWITTSKQAKLATRW